MQNQVKTGQRVVSSDGYLIGTVEGLQTGNLVVQTDNLFLERAFLPEDQIADVTAEEVVLRSTFAGVSAIAAEQPPGAPLPRDPSVDWAVGLDSKYLESEQHGAGY